MVLQTAPRVCATEAPSMIAVGFTATKKLGGAVVRNRIKRRLRAAVDTVMPDAAHAGHDYVLIGRKAALNAPFEKICKDLQWALRKLHA